MRPVLFYIGPVAIWSYGTFIALGMITLFAMALLSARRDARSWEQLLPVAMGVMVGGVFGARLLHLIVEPAKFAQLIDFYSLFRPGTPGNTVGLMVGGYLGGLAIVWDCPRKGTTMPRRSRRPVCCGAAVACWPAPVTGG